LNLTNNNTKSYSQVKSMSNDRNQTDVTEFTAQMLSFDDYIIFLIFEKG